MGKHNTVSMWAYYRATDIEVASQPDPNYFFSVNLYMNDGTTFELPLIAKNTPSETGLSHGDDIRHFLFTDLSDENGLSITDYEITRLITPHDKDFDKQLRIFKLSEAAKVARARANVAKSRKSSAIREIMDLSVRAHEYELKYRG